MNTHFLVKWIAVLALLSFVGATGPSAAPVRKGNYLLADWTGVDEQSGRCRFSFPGGYRRETQPDQVIYSVEGDNLSYQMHYFNTANVDTLAAPVPRLSPDRLTPPRSD